MKTIFVVTTVVKEYRGTKQVILGGYESKEQAQQVAEASLTQEGGVMAHWITWRTANGYDPLVVKEESGTTTQWGRFQEGADWHTQTSFLMAAKVEEIIVHKVV